MIKAKDLNRIIREKFEVRVKGSRGKAVLLRHYYNRSKLVVLHDNGSCDTETKEYIMEVYEEV